MTTRPKSPLETDEHDLAFRARALAQAHALSEPAVAYRRWRVERDRAAHPIPELTTWAATAFLTGYCVRCVEESLDDVGEKAPGAAIRPGERGLDDWEHAATRFANDLPTNADATICAHAVTIGALDDVIEREIEKRSEHVKEHLSDDDWQQFGAFIGWWTVHGYAVRAVERR